MINLYGERIRSNATIEEYFKERNTSGGIDKLKKYLLSLPEAEQLFACIYLLPKTINPKLEPHLFKLLLLVLSAANRLQVVKRDYDGDNLLHLACKKDVANQDSSLPMVGFILYSLPKKERKALVWETNQDGNTIFDLAKIDMTPTKLNFHNSYLWLGWAVRIPSAGELKDSLAHMSIDERKEACISLLLPTLWDGRSHLILPDLLQVVLETLPETSRLVAIKKDFASDTNCFLHHALQRRRAVVIIFSLLSKAECLSLGLERNGEGKTVFELLSQESLLEIECFVSIPSIENSAYSPVKNKEMSVFYQKINQLKDYGIELCKTQGDSSDGKEVVCLAFKLIKLAYGFFTTESAEEQEAARAGFEKVWAQGYSNLRKNDERWKDMLEDIYCMALMTTLVAPMLNLIFQGNSSTFFTPSTATEQESHSTVGLSQSFTGEHS